MYDIWICCVFFPIDWNIFYCKTFDHCTLFLSENMRNKHWATFTQNLKVIETSGFFFSPIYFVGAPVFLPQHWKLLGTERLMPLKLLGMNRVKWCMLGVFLLSESPIQDMSVRIFWVCAMEYMCAQTRPRFIIVCSHPKQVLGGMESEPMLYPKGNPEKSPLPGQPAEHTTHWAIPAPQPRIKTDCPCHLLILLWYSSVCMCKHVCECAHTYAGIHTRMLKNNNNNKNHHKCMHAYLML